MNTSPITTVQLPSYRNNESIKKYLIKHKIKENKCEHCGLDKWLGKDICLNLRVEIPNQGTTCPKNLKLVCSNCAKSLCTILRSPGVIRYNTNTGRKILPTRKFHIDRTTLEKLVHCQSVASIGREYNISECSVRYRCLVENIVIPKFPRGHFRKIPHALVLAARMEMDAARVKIKTMDATILQKIMTAAGSRKETINSILGHTKYGRSLCGELNIRIEKDGLNTSNWKYK